MTDVQDLCVRPPTLSPYLAQCNKQSSQGLVEEFPSKINTPMSLPLLNSTPRVKSTTSPKTYKKRSPSRRFAPYRPSPARKNLFLEGFQDCSTEVLRFLRDVEQMDDDNPLFAGLQTHLNTMTRVFCQENIADIDFEAEDEPTLTHPPNNDVCPAALCYDSPVCSTLSPMNSPTFTTFTRTSELNTSFSESDMSLSQSHNCSQSPLVLSTSSDTISSNKNVFNFENHHMNSPCRCPAVSSLPSTPSDNSTVLPRQCQHTVISTQHRLADDVVKCHKHSLESLHKSLDVSQPIPVDHNNPISDNTDVLVVPVGIASIQNFSTEKTLPSSCPTSIQNNASNNFAETQGVSSSFQLTPNFFPGSDSTCLDSENFTDTLLGIESCRDHDDPRVRALANELIHLIQEEAADDDDDDDEDEAEDEDECPTEPFESETHRHDVDLQRRSSTSSVENIVDAIEQ